MIFLLSRIIDTIVFFLLFLTVSYFFILDKNVKKTLISSVASIIVFILVDIFSPLLLYFFLNLSEFLYYVVH
ncbi:hypothetical protein AA106_16270 [Photorhabdus laumondii subsp. laumondii]|nr:hypothetical protein A4R40_03605 [Photorhabdus laumondii subsp. laumondii]RAW65273.1 hypothetical protein CKY15_21975 [Photorhabdus sp. S7-51]RAW66917.1 hypothetical protein CKY14_21930 [Photorhabdus sp. S14-60]RAW71863.1 hypothetical protein CKY06_22055 [Photorhabdus sp. S15-56]AXG46007.1 hypothetical protein PluTT01m_03710 [Photorhabdus laumondii subsp. laumondii]